MTHLLPCSACAELVPDGACTCPHCGARKPCASRKLPQAALILGISVGLAACLGGQKDYSGVIFDDEEEGSEEAAEE